MHAAARLDSPPGPTYPVAMYPMADRLDGANRFRPHWRAGLMGWLAQTSIAWLCLTVMIELSNAALDEGHMFEGDGREFQPRPSIMPSWGWLQDTGLLFGHMAAIALPGAILLVLVMALAERTSDKPLIVWLLAGCAAAAPLSLYIMISAGAASPSPTPVVGYLFLSLVPCAFGAFGAAAAWRARPGRWA